MPTETNRDYLIRFREENMAISTNGDFIIYGPETEKFRRLVLNHSEFYSKYLVPYLIRWDSSFKPSQLWIDPKGTIHITNKRIVRKAMRHLISAHRRNQE